MAREEGENRARKRPNSGDSSADVRKTKHGRLGRKFSDSKLNEEKEVQGIIQPSMLLEPEHRLSPLKH